MKKLVVLCLIFALLGTQLVVIAQEPPDAAAMLLDVPLRVLGFGAMVVTGAVFVIALPFTLSSGSFSDAWDVLVVGPFEFVFTRPLGRFDNWRAFVSKKTENIEPSPVTQEPITDNVSKMDLSPST